MDPLSVGIAVISGAIKLYQASKAKARAFSAWVFAQKLDQDVTLQTNAQTSEAKIDALRKTETDILGDLRS